MIEVAGITTGILEKHAEPFIKKGIKMSLKKWEKFKIDSERAFAKYLENAYEKHHKIKTLLYKSEPKDIYDFFVCPRLHCGIEHEIILRPETIQIVTDISHFVIISGTGGIGKSTLMKHLFVSALQSRFRIPVFFELKNINDNGKEFEIKSILYEILQDLEIEFDKDNMEYALKRGCFVFILDGYDEIMSEHKKIFHKKLEAFCDRYSKNYFILSSRPYTEFVEFQRFNVLETCRLDKKESIELISKLDFDKTVKEKFISALKEKLFKEHYTFASNPLLLIMMLMTYDNYAEIPNKLHIFYSLVFDTLYFRHDATKAGYVRESKSNLSQNDFKKVMAYFSYITYQKGMLEFSKIEIYDILKKVYDILNKDEKRVLEFNIEHVLSDMTNSLCLINMEGFVYVYAHRSFQEYFTAVFLKELSDENLQRICINMIETNGNRFIHDNILPMLYDMNKASFEKNILLPMLCYLESDYIQGNDKYMYYLEKCFNSLHIVPHLDRKGKPYYEKLNKSYYVRIDKKYLFDLKYDNKENKENDKAKSTISEFLIKCSHNLYDKPHDQENFLQFYKYCTYKKSKYGIAIPYIHFVEDEKLLGLFKMTGFGKRIHFLSCLKDNLEKKRQSFDEELFKL